MKITIIMHKCFTQTCCYLHVQGRWNNYVPSKHWYLSTELHGATSQKKVLIFITAITSNITLAEASHCIIIKYTYTPLVSTTVHPFLIFLLHISTSLRPKHVTGIMEMQRRTVLPTRCVFNFTQASHNKTECFLPARNLSPVIWKQISSCNA